MKTCTQDTVRSLGLPAFRNNGNQANDLTLHDILYLKADSNYTVFTLQSGQQIITGFSLKRYKKLEGFSFIQTNRSFIINQLHISTVDFDNHSLTMNNGTSIDISRRRKPFLKRLLFVQ